MNRIIDNISEKFKSIWPSSLSSVETQEKQLVEGYHISSDATQDKTLVLVKHSDKFWKTEWFDNAATTYKAPLLPLNELFVKRN
jgi:hypothetical protein